MSPGLGRSGRVYAVKTNKHCPGAAGDEGLAEGKLWTAADGHTERAEVMLAAEQISARGAVL